MFYEHRLELERELIGTVVACPGRPESLWT
jgi:hypothetical protein